MTQREAFEAWMSDDGKWNAAIERDSTGNYLLLTTANYWGVWQAAQAQAAVEPVGYFYFDDGVYKQAGDPISFPGCVKLYTSPPDHTKAMRLALEIIRLQREWIMAVPQDTVLPVMPGFDREWVDRQIAALEKVI